MSWRFFRRFFVLPWLSVNVSKRGASVSVGPQGAKLTMGTSGTQVTGGIPGTGLFVTKRFSVLGALESMNAARASKERAEWRKAFVDHLRACLENRQVTVAQMKAALAYRDTLRLTDEEIGKELLDVVATVAAMIREAEEKGRSTFHPSR